MFAYSQIKSGRNHLGALLGDVEYCNSFKKGKVTNWIAEIERLSSITKSQPHDSKSALVQCPVIEGLSNILATADLAPLQ